MSTNHERTVMDTPASIVMPITVGDDDMVEIRYGDLRDFADAYICAYFGIRGEFPLARAEWGLTFANSIMNTKEVI